MPGQVKGLTVLTPLLLLAQGALTLFGGCPGTRAEVGQPLQQTVGISTHYCDTEGAPYLAHDFAQVARPRPSLQALCALKFSGMVCWTVG